MQHSMRNRLSGMEIWSILQSLDAMVDGTYAALKKIHAGNSTIVIAESYWPSAGQEHYTSKEIASMYKCKSLF